MYPKITSPCPYKFSALPGVEKNFCTHCQKKVHNLDGMCVQERKSLIAASGGEICVAYSVPKTVAVLGASLALSLSAATLAAVPLAQAQESEQEISEVMLLGTVTNDNEWFEARDVQALPEITADTPELEFTKEPTH